MVICRFLGNACIEIIGSKDHIIVDPVFLSSPKDGIKKIFITHEHNDHIDLQKIADIHKNYSKNENLEIYAPKIVKKRFNIEINPKREIELHKGTVYVLDNNCWKSDESVAYLIEIRQYGLEHKISEQVS